MMKKMILILITVLAIGIVAGCKNDSVEKEHSYNIKIMLDYYTNTNHAGLYYAKEKGYFNEAGYEIQIVESGETDPLALLATDKIDFAYSYEENIIFSQNSDEKMPVKAISKIIDYNTSGFMYKKSLGINSFSDFAGKSYGSWNSELEQAIIDSLEKKYELNDPIIKKSAITGSVADLDNGIDFLWVFEGWDMTLLKSQGVEEEYEFMSLKELDSNLDFYTPLIASKNNVNTKKAEDFLEILNRGYKECFENKEECASILTDTSSELDEEHVNLSLEYLENKIIVGSEFGYMEESKWKNFYNWLSENGVVQKEINYKELFTNEYIKN